MYGPINYITNEVKAIKGYILTPSKPVPVENLIANIVAIGEVDELWGKYYEIRKVEEALRRTNPNFKGFYTKVSYPSNLKKMVENFDYIMSQIPHEPEGEEAIVNRESPKWCWGITKIRDFLDIWDHTCIISVYFHKMNVIGWVRVFIMVEIDDTILI